MNNFQKFLIVPGYAVFSIVIFIIQLFNYRFSVYAPIAVYISYLLGITMWAFVLISALCGSYQLAIILSFCFVSSGLLIKVD